MTIKYGKPGTNGGGIENQGTLVIENCVIQDCEASGGSAPYGQGGGIRNGGSLTIKNSIIQNNTSSNFRGGGIFHYGTDLTIDNCIIQGNKAYTQGGGIQVENATSNINNSLIYNNQITITSGSDNNGAGVFYGTSGSGTYTNYLTNCTISGNIGSSATYGGGIGMTSSGNSTSNVILTNVTIADNTAANAHGIQQYAYDYSYNNLTLLNCIISNTNSNNAFLYKATNATRTITRISTILRDNTITLGSGSGDANNTDPLINSLDNNGGFTKTYSLQTSSPAKDNGTATGAPTIDQRGLPRNTIDIGAFEDGYKVWTGKSSTDWADGSNWIGGVPTSSDNIYILPNYENQPTIGSSTSAVCKDIVIYPNASLTINSGGSLSPSGSFLIKSDETGTGILIDNNSSSSLSGTIQLYMTGGSGGYVHYVSSPITNATGSNIIGAYNSYKFDDNASPKWIRIFNGDNLDPGIGYYVAYDANTTKSFTGTFNTGTISPSITNGVDKYSLIGNPYPSPVSISAFISGNTTTTTGALYFWDDDHSNGSGYATDDYSVRNNTGVTLSKQGNFPNSIAIGQGFIIKSNNNGNTVTFTNAMRVDTVCHFFTPENNIMQKFWFDMTNDKGAFNQILIAFSAFGTDDFDIGFDADKLSGNPNLSFYSISQDKTQYFVIQNLSNFELNKSVPLGFYAGEKGSFVIKLSNFENLLHGTSIVLEDKITSSLTDLTKEKIYSFNSEKGEFNDRFILHFNIGINDNKEQDAEFFPNFYLYGSSLYVFLNMVPIGDYYLKISDLAGREIFSYKLSNQNSKINLNLHEGLYIASLWINGKKISKKIIIH